MPEDRTRLADETHIADVDVAYTTYFPLLEPYVSLYPDARRGAEDHDDDDDDDNDDHNTTSKKTPAARAALHAPRPDMWRIVEQTMAQGQRALERLRDRRAVPAERVKQADTATAKHAVDEDDDDRGFFEES